MIDILLALAAGVLTVGAPCVLPVLPILFGSSIGQSSRCRPFFIALGFTLSFSGVALVLSVSSTLLGLSPSALRDVAIVLLLVFGALMIWPHPFEWLSARLGGLTDRANAVGDRAGQGSWGGLVLGMTLGVVWTPCAGPVLGSILTLVATSPDLAWAGLLLVCYAIGAGVPMLLIAYGGQYFAARARRLARVARPVQQVFGVLTVLFAVGVYYGYDTQALVWLSGFYPDARVGL